MKYIEEFITARRIDGLAKSTLGLYEQELKVLAKYLDKPTIKVSTEDLRSYLGQFKDKAQRTVNRKISTMKAFYSWLVQEGVIIINPTGKIKTPKEPETLPRNIQQNDVELLRWQPKSIRNQAIMELLLSTGLRISEMSGLNRNDLDMINRQIRVTGKGSKERLVFFSQIAKFCIKNYLGTRKDLNPALFINRYGDRLSTRSVEGQIKDLARKAGIINKVTPHMLRHTFATGLYENGADIDFIARLLGHARVDTTRRYTHINRDAMARMYDKFIAS